MGVLNAFQIILRRFIKFRWRFRGLTRLIGEFHGISEKVSQGLRTFQSFSRGVRLMVDSIIPCG